MSFIKSIMVVVALSMISMRMLLGVMLVKSLDPREELQSTRSLSAEHSPAGSAEPELIL